MKIAVDLDGVCYEWESTARYMLREYRGLTEFKGYPLSQPSNAWDYIPNNIPASEWEWLWTRGVELGLFRYGHVTRGSILGLRDLLEDGHELLAVTHRPTNAVPDTMAWLAYLNIPWTEVHILSNGEPKTVVDAEVLIDDKPENVEAWREAGRTAFLFSRPWNTSVADKGRVHGWEGVLEAVYDYCERTTGHP